jgi:hypothetical protein
MVGAACGLLVAVHVGSNIPTLTTQGFVVIMTISGALGFYLGIDTPPLVSYDPSKIGAHGKADIAELLSAVGTFIAALAAFASISIIVLRDDAHRLATILILLGWLVGVTMQTIAGAIARTRQ